MTEPRFIWNENKNLSNQRKHGITFEDAISVFADPLHVMRQDRIESGEHRWQTVGAAYGVTLLLVAHTITEESPEGQLIEVIRLISARKANKSERRRYETEND